MTAPAASTIRVGTAHATDRDAATAGRTAAAAAVAALEGEAPALVMVFATPRYDLPALLAGIRSVTGDALLVGATGSGEIAGATYLGFGGGVGVMAMTAGRYRFAAASEGDISPDDLDAAGRRLARAARESAGPSPHALALLLTDSLLGDLQQFVQGVYRVVGAKVAIAGGAAGDEQRFVESSVFHNGQVLKHGALVLWIGSDHPLTVVMRHGWSPMGSPMLVTGAVGTEIAELGGRAADAAYEEALGLGTPLAADAFWGTAISHPFGLLQADGTHVIRTARRKNPDGSLTIQGCVPSVGSAVQVMDGSPELLLSVTGEVVETALAAAPPSPGVLLAFSCAARAMILDARAPEEAERLQAIAGDIPVFGFYCCGEFARTAGVLATHNATLTAVAL